MLANQETPCAKNECSTNGRMLRWMCGKTWKDRIQKTKKKEKEKNRSHIEHLGAAFFYMNSTYRGSINR